jgi:hypothetical protein
MDHNQVGLLQIVAEYFRVQSLHIMQDFYAKIQILLQVVKNVGYGVGSVAMVVTDVFQKNEINLYKEICSNRGSI